MVIHALCAPCIRGRPCARQGRGRGRVNFRAVDVHAKFNLSFVQIRVAASSNPIPSGIPVPGISPAPFNVRGEEQTLGGFMDMIRVLDICLTGRHKLPIWVNHSREPSVIRRIKSKSRAIFLSHSNLDCGSIKGDRSLIGCPPIGIDIRRLGHTAKFWKSSRCCSKVLSLGINGGSCVFHRIRFFHRIRCRGHVSCVGCADAPATATAAAAGGQDE